jgi:hypothetical protein
MKNRRRIAALAVLLAALGVARMAGMYLPWPAFSRFARSLGVSPNPAPFATVRTWPGFESRGTDFVCERADGASSTVRWSHEVLGRIEAPVRVRTYFSSLISRFRVDDPRRERALLERVLCRDTVFSRALGCTGPLRAVEIRFYDHRGEENRFRKSYRFACGETAP